MLLADLIIMVLSLSSLQSTIQFLRVKLVAQDAPGVGIAEEFAPPISGRGTSEARVPAVSRVLVSSIRSPNIPTRQSRLMQ